MEIEARAERKARAEAAAEAAKERIAERAREAQEEERCSAASAAPTVLARASSAVRSEGSADEDDEGDGYATAGELSPAEHLPAPSAVSPRLMATLCARVATLERSHSRVAQLEAAVADLRRDAETREEAHRELEAALEGKIRALQARLEAAKLESSMRPPEAAPSAFGGGRSGTAAPPMSVLSSTVATPFRLALPEKIAQISEVLGLPQCGSLIDALQSANAAVGLPDEGGLIAQADRLLRMLLQPPQSKRAWSEGAVVGGAPPPRQAMLGLGSARNCWGQLYR